MEKIVVCVPIHNEEKNIEEVVKSIFSQKIDLEVSLLVISSGSMDNSNIIIKEYIRKGFPIDLVIEHSRKGKASALNSAFEILEEKTFDYCIFTDGDVLFGEKSFMELINQFKNNEELVCVAGNPQPRGNLKGIWQRIAIENCTIWDLVRLKLSIDNRVWVLSGYLFGMKKSALPKAVPIDQVAEDAYIGMQLLKYGGKLGYSTGAKVFVKFPKNIYDYYLQKSRTRSGWRQIKKLNPSGYKELKKIQLEVIVLRTRSGNLISLICWLLDIIIWFMDGVWGQRMKNRHLWQSIKSTKG